MACNFSDLFFTCSLIEFIGRAQRLSRREVVAGLGAATLAHIYAHKGTDSEGTEWGTAPNGANLRTFGLRRLGGAKPVPPLTPGAAS